MTLEVIGAGFGRTGTLSLKHALEQLGFSKCHHMLEVFENPAQAVMFRDAGRGLPVDWNEVFRGYRAMVDWPGSCFWRELAEFYPRAKVLLSVRDADEWYDSASATIFRAMKSIAAGSVTPPGSAAIPPAGAAMPPGIAAQSEMAFELIVKGTFGGSVADRANCIRAYNDNTERVLAEIAPERLLVFEAKQGWEPLCRFLDVPVPATDYPRVNSRDEFLQRLATRDMGRSGPG